jgi:hypothetical protein
LFGKFWQDWSMILGQASKSSEMSILNWGA